MTPTVQVLESIEGHPVLVQLSPYNKAVLCRTLELAIERGDDLRSGECKFRDEGALVNTQIINERDRALADIHALRDILKVPEGGNLVDHASAFAERHMRRVDDSTAEGADERQEVHALRASVTCLARLGHLLAGRAQAGSAPEAWRAAMREWTANGNRPSVDPKPLSYAVTSREDAT